MGDRERLRSLQRSTNQREVLIRLAWAWSWQRGAEIGVLKGKTLFSVLEAVPFLSMIGVDQWRILPLRDDECAETYDPYNMRVVESEVRQQATRFGPRCAILKGDSSDVAARVEDESLDFVFIDADHTETGCRRDILAWAPKVKPSGMVLGHDNHWPTVRRVIDDLCPGWKDYGEAVWGISKRDVRC